MLEPFDEAEIWIPTTNVRSSRLLGTAFLVFAGISSLGLLVLYFFRG